MNRSLLGVLQNLGRDGSLTVAVRDSCMTPWLGDGDRVVVASRRCYWPGDVLVFERQFGVLCAHRLIGYRVKNRSLELITRGDRAPIFDRPVRPDQVLGKVVGTSSPAGIPRLAAMRAWLRGIGALMRHAVARTSPSSSGSRCSARPT